MMKRAIVDEIHRPARRNYPRRKYDIRGLDESWQGDLVEMQPYSRENKGYRYMLTLIDSFSKYAWAVPLKSKTGVDVTAAMKSVLEKGRVPKNFLVDQGLEFFNQHFEALMKKYKINMYSTYSNVKASICERFNRTLKTRMWKMFSLQGNYKWLDILPDLLKSYNSTKHRTINMKPKDVNRENEKQVLARFTDKRKLPTKPKFKVNQAVRISKVKQLFEKGYTPNWSAEIFTITKVLKTKPITYLLKDYRDDPVAGSFYQQELTSVKYPDAYLVEKVLKKRGDQALVRWLGFDKTHDSWINQADI